MVDHKYGTCTDCKTNLKPIWFKETEYKVDSRGIMTKTGRTRTACSHLECPLCLKNYCVDDTFDGRWY